ncbi:MAG: histidine kinase, partial [Spirochaetaceae bacterium]|nr:histidine kinase [Spirochaetaceae bacterium]
VNAGYIAPLSPGKYMLRVKASNGNGTWNDYGASLGIAVTPPWWGTWWFRSSAIGAFIVLAGAAMIARTGSLRKRNALLVQFARHIDDAREEERKTAARDIHDEIGQHLMALNFHAYWLASHPEAQAAARGAKISEIQKAIRDAMESVKTVAGRLRPAALEVQDLPDALRLQLFAFKRMSGIEARMDLAEGWREPPKPIAAAALRIFQEMLGNVARHSGARRVAVRLSQEGETLALRVADDGTGIDAAKIDAPDSFGIIGMRERCVAFGGTLDFEEAEGGGCAVVARLPLGAGKGERKGA